MDFAPNNFAPAASDKPWLPALAVENVKPFNFSFASKSKFLLSLLIKFPKPIFAIA